MTPKYIHLRGDGIRFMKSRMSCWLPNSTLKIIATMPTALPPPNQDAAKTYAELAPRGFPLNVRR